MRLILKWLACTASILIIWLIFPAYVQIDSTNALLTIAGAGTILWAANAILRPIAQLVSILFTILTFGLFSFVINAFMVMLTDALLPGLKIENFWICLLISLIVSVFNALITSYRNK